MSLPSVADPDGRRYWSFLVILGGCFIFTAMAAIAIWLTRNDVKLAFYLGLAAHVQLLIGMSTFGFVLGRRVRGKAGRDGFEFDDTGVEPVKAIVETKTEIEVPPAGA